MLNLLDVISGMPLYKYVLAHPKLPSDSAHCLAQYCEKLKIAAMDMECGGQSIGHHVRRTIHEQNRWARLH
jgi:hypothetical protein